MYNCICDWDIRYKCLLFLVLKSIKQHEAAWPFIEAVDERYATCYYDIIKVRQCASSTFATLFNHFYYVLSIHSCYFGIQCWKEVHLGNFPIRHFHVRKLDNKCYWFFLLNSLWTLYLVNLLFWQEYEVNFYGRAFLVDLFVIIYLMNLCMK